MNINERKHNNHHEHNEQVLLFHWAELNKGRYPILNYLHSSQNGMKTASKLHALRAKRAGMKKGVPDVFLPYPKKDKDGNIIYLGLFIEMKRKIVKGEPKPQSTREQEAWIKYLNEVGYKATLCYGANEAIDCVKDYISYAEPYQKNTTGENPLD